MLPLVGEPADECSVEAEMTEVPDDELLFTRSTDELNESSVDALWPALWLRPAKLLLPPLLPFSRPDGEPERFRLCAAAAELSDGLPLARFALLSTEVLF